MTRVRASIGIASAGFLGLVLAGPCFFAPLFDDAYIHARSAEQLLSTGRPDFNLGTALKTDSSTGYLLLLAGFGWLSGNVVTALRAIQGISVVLFVTRLYLLSLALNARLTPIHTGLIACALPPFLWSAYGGMESSTAAVCLVLSATAALREKHGAALLYASFAVSMRLELSPFLISYALWLAYRERGVPRALVACFPLATCLLFDAFNYGSIVPHAALAKSVAYDLPWGEALRLALSVSFERHVWPLAALQAACFLFWLRGRMNTRSPSPVVDGLTVTMVLLVGAWTMSRSIMFPWYVAAFSGLLTLAALFGTRDGGPISAFANTQRICIVAFQAAIGCLAALALRIDLGASSSELASVVRVERYLTIGAALYQHCPSCALASSEIGGLGYGFRGRIDDALGLADRAALRFHPLRVPEQRASYRVGAIPPAYIALRDPDFVVSMPLFSEAFRRSTIVHAFVRYDCPLVPERPERSLWGDTVIQVFSKQPLPEPTRARMGCVEARARAGEQKETGARAQN